LGIRLGATPRGHDQPNMPSSAALPKGDILIWQNRGHFHLALTETVVAVLLACDLSAVIST
jgi:hypothetical protein